MSQTKTPELRDALIARFKYGETTKEIARRNQVAPGTLRKCFSRELARLRKVLKKKLGYDQPAPDVTSRIADISPDKSQVQKSRHGRGAMKQWRKA